MAATLDGKFLLAAVQIDIPSCAPPENLSRAVSIMEKDPGADLYLLPELFTSDFRLENAYELALCGGETLAALKDFAARKGSAVCGSILLSHGGGVANTGFFIDRDGSVAALYPKAHLFGPMGEDKYLVAGQGAAAFDTTLGRVGMGICYDLRFPEMIRTLALEGAGIFLLPAQWPAARKRHYEILLAARAIENAFFVLSANRVGSHGGSDFAGGSSLIDPWGEPLALAGGCEEVIRAEADLSKVGEARRKIPALADRVRGIDFKRTK